jgi:hypothetical protein
MMNWKGFGRKWLSPDRCVVLSLAWRTTHKNLNQESPVIKPRLEFESVGHLKKMDTAKVTDKCIDIKYRGKKPIG